MRIDYGDWKRSRDTLIARIEASRWQDGISTDDAMTEVLAEGGFPSDPALMFEPQWRRKNAAIWSFTLYYFVQSGLKNRYFSRVGGSSGKKLRLRAIYNVEHGVDGELDESGEPLKSDRKGLWLFWRDFQEDSAGRALEGYQGQGANSKDIRRFLEVMVIVLGKHPSGTRAGDCEDEIFRNL